MFEKLKSLALEGSGELAIDAEGTPTTQDLHIVIAVFIVKIVVADGEIRQQEREALLRSLVKQFEISNEDAMHLLEVADFLHRDDKQLQDFTDIVNERFAMPQKERIVAMMLRVASADGVFSEQEQKLVAEAATLMGMTEENIERAKNLQDSQEV